MCRGMRGQVCEEPGVNSRSGDQAESPVSRAGVQCRGKQELLEAPSLDRQNREKWKTSQLCRHLNGERGLNQDSWVLIFIQGWPSLPQVPSSIPNGGVLSVTHVL